MFHERFQHAAASQICLQLYHIETVDALGAKGKPIALAAKMIAASPTDFHGVATFDLLHACIAKPIDLAAQRLSPTALVIAGHEKVRVVAGIDDRLIVIDDRPVAQSSKVVIEGIERLIYEYCDDMRSLKQIVSWINETHSEDVSANRVRKILDGFIDSRLMIKERRLYLSLAIMRHLR